MQLNLKQKKNFDPVYEAVTFSKGKYGKLKAKIFSDLLFDSLEFNRLSFILQEGFTWLEFPSVNHTRFAATLGVWHLADIAIDQISVHWKEKYDGGVLPQKCNLGQFLGDWETEFRLAAMIHDLGHFPFTLTIETNDKLKQKFAEYTASDECTVPGVDGPIDLLHEDFGVSVICNAQQAEFVNDHLESNQQRICHLYEHFRKTGLEGQTRAPIADLLGKLVEDGMINLKRLIFFLDPTPKIDNITSDDLERTRYRRDLPPLTENFLLQARELVVGKIDVGNLDRYARLAYQVSGRGGSIPVRRFVQSLGIQTARDSQPFDPSNEDQLKNYNPRYQLGIYEDDVETAFEVLYHVRNSIIPNILNDENRLAYETMLNDALNRHWDHLSEPQPDSVGENEQRKHSNFKDHFLFYCDDFLLSRLRESDNEEVRRIIDRIRQGVPYWCIGRYRLTDEAFRGFFRDSDLRPGQNLSKEQLKGLQKERRDNLQGLFDAFRDDHLQIRMTKSFGIPLPSKQTKEGIDQEAEAGKVMQTGSARTDWMNLSELYVLGENGPSRLDTDPLHEDSVDVINASLAMQRRTFWIFSSEIIPSEDIAERRKEIDKRLRESKQFKEILEAP